MQNYDDGQQNSTSFNFHDFPDRLQWRKHSHCPSAEGLLVDKEAAI
jgi:hypothetical protein